MLKPCHTKQCFHCVGTELFNFSVAPGDRKKTPIFFVKKALSRCPNSDQDVPTQDILSRSKEFLLVTLCALRALSLHSDISTNAIKYPCKAMNNHGICTTHGAPIAL